FKASSEIKKRGSYKLQVKAKLSSYLLLKEEDRLRLKYLLDIGASEKNTTSTSRATVTHYPYVRCLAFASIFLHNDEICGIAEYLEHSEQCLSSQPQRDLQYRLLPYVKKSNIDIKNDAAKNLDQILGSKVDQSELKDACLYYQPHTKENDRLEIIISTHEQQEYAWKYSHQNLILVNRTFGISRHKLLLFIVMIIDSNNKGIPIFFILFTPPRSNRLTSSEYDSKILEPLFTIFRDKISDNYNKKNQSLATPVIFSPCAAMTDTDIKERKSLSKVWPGIILLLCYFHISQCCKNEINKQLDRGGENKARLMDSSEEMVCNYITKKKESLEYIYKTKNLSENKKILEGGLNFLSYLKKQWGGDLLSSWCLNGRMNAAKALRIPLEKLPTTNNHLEEMNEPNTPIEVSQSNVPTSALTLQKYNIADIDDLNAAAIYQQEIKEFLESTSKCLHELQNNLMFLQNLVKSKHSSAQEHFNCSDQNALLSHLHNVVNLDAFKKAQNLVNNIHKETDHRRLVVSDTGIIPLERKKKQQQKPLYKS
ncbi:12655_t:CDS:2, partial [Cetraspora pellucida]